LLPQVNRERHVRKTVGASECISDADRDVTEHNKTPVCALLALTGVISSETGQAVFLLGKANSIALATKVINKAIKSTSTKL
jgi:hypothetical protein